ncbi:transcription factor bHLH112-like isoform X1 [Salvia miltiorrhiza]|uniref:transcription factor bHLH112-like isoform X1 n=1 Tax=Salvia miltiorrhiza TaxID=226208 RepID=UPI0025AC4D0B|nr:transcription factor bHLH112-like isoform X1 [Salvia miltiorrhiza]
MAEEFLQGGVSWWNSPRNLFSWSPCSLASNDGWPTTSVRSSDESAASDGSSSLVIQDHQPPPDAAMMGLGLSPSDAWNQDLLRDSGRSEDNYSNLLLDSTTTQIKNFSGEDSSMKQANQCFGSAESYSYASSLLQTLFDTDSQPHPSLLDHQTALSYSSVAAADAHQINSNGFLPKPSPTANRLWNASPTFPPSDHFFPSSLTNQIHSIATKQHEQGKDLAATVVKKASNEPAFKRPRIETPSPLPTFKVRKEKLGDRITALQQLVSPFGKTDTASVLHEAIEYIKFLHDQVNALSTPYLKYGAPPVQRQQAAGDKDKDEEKDLKTRGLCLVPISSTFPVAAETTSDFWTPTFGGSFR